MGGAARDWYLTKAERANDDTAVDAQHEGERAWSEGNLVRPLIHGTAYFAELYERVQATRPGDLIYFTDWQGSADERLTGEPGSEIIDVFGAADRRGVDVRGLVWRSHSGLLGFFSRQNRSFGEELQHQGAEVLLDMRVRMGGAHHQKFVVIRHRDDPSRDIAYVGGIDLAHNRRDDDRHLGDPQSDPMCEEYGEHPPWHDVQVAIQGPAVHDVETVFRERWQDPTPLTVNPVNRLYDRLRRTDVDADPLPEQAPPPPPAGDHPVQLLRTYPNLRHGQDYPFARGGERSVARGYTKAMARARRMMYVEDQYLWGHDVATSFRTALAAHPELRVVAVLPLIPDVGEGLGGIPQLLGRERAIRDLLDVAPDRVAVYGIENEQGTPIYVHAKVCVLDDLWASVGSDNFNRRSWTHDSELSAVVLDEDYARTLRLRLAAEHLGRLSEVADDGSNLAEVMADCVEAPEMFATFREAARRLDDWHAGGRRGERPPGRLRLLDVPDLNRWQRLWARLPLNVVHDPDGRPGPLRGGTDY